jgi:hypothetical protein
MQHPRPSFRIVFVLVLASCATAGACGSQDRAPFDEDAPGDAGTKKVDAAPPAPPPPEDAAVDADAGDAGWPTCDAKPASAVDRTIPQIWQADPATETETWVKGAYVTAISGASCTANKTCQIFLQADPSYPSLAAAAKHGIKLLVSGAVASYFTSVRVGDVVDVLGWAWRYTLDGQRELLLQVNAKLPGCAKTRSANNALTPIAGVTLDDLTLDKYETTHGPLFVRVTNVSGRPDLLPTATFGLWPTTDSGTFDAGPDGGASIVSLSPYFMSGSSFTGLSPGTVTRFASITGVFGLFAPSPGAKYLEIYPRSMGDVVVAP